MTKADIIEIHYVLAGAGTVTVNNETAPIKTGDSIPVDFGQTRSFTRTGSEPLELFVNAVARNIRSKTESPRRAADAGQGRSKWRLGFPQRRIPLCPSFLTDAVNTRSTMLPLFKSIVLNRTLRDFEKRYRNALSHLTCAGRPKIP